MAMLVSFTARNRIQPTRGICLVWKSHNAPHPNALGQKALHDSSLRCAKKTRALLDCEEQVNQEVS